MKLKNGNGNLKFSCVSSSCQNARGLKVAEKANTPPTSQYLVVQES
jgi:hypothetical protein